MAIQDITKPMALDETLQATNQALGGVAKDTSLQATNTALGLLGKDSSLQAIVTALATIGLNTVGNLAQLTTEQKTSLVAAINELMAGKIPNSAIGVANGVAELDANGLVPANQLPSFVDDVLNGTAQNVTETGAGTYSATAFILEGESTPCTPEDGKTYVDITSNIQYRWTGSVFVSMGSNLTLGETNRTAYRGDRGKTAYDHSQDASRVTSATAEGLYKVGATAQGHISSLSAVQKSDITALGIPGQDTTYDDATQSVHGLMSANDKTKLDGISAGSNKVEASDTNGNIKIDGTETQVYDDSDIQGKLSTTLTPISGNPISISGLKSTQLAVDPVITFEPIQDLHGQSKPYPAGGGKNKFDYDTVYGSFKQSNGTFRGIMGDVIVTVFNVGAYKNKQMTFSVYIDLTLESSPTRCVAGAFVNGVGIEGNNILANEKGYSTVTFTPETDNDYIHISFGSGQNNYITFYNVQLEEGNARTAWSPYENICPISGYDKIEVLSCGKNLVYKRLSGLSINDSGTVVSLASYDLLLVKVVKDAIYTMTKGVSDYDICAFFTSEPALNSVSYNNARTFVQQTDLSFSITAPITGYMAFRTVSSYAKPHCEFGSTSLTYEDYHKTTDLSENLPQTVYGLTHEVRTGKARVTWKKVVYDGSSDESWTKSTNGFYIAAHDLIKILDYANSIKCDKLQLTSYFNIVDGSITNAIAGYRDSSGAYPGQNWIYIGVGGISDVASLKTWLSNNPIEVCYAVATPAEIQLTPHEIALSQGYNYISTNGSQIQLSYHNGELASLGDVAESELYTMSWVKKLMTRLSSVHLYAFHIDGATGEVTYLEDNANYTPAYMDYTKGSFNYASWQDAFFMPKPCVLGMDGHVKCYLDPYNYAKDIDGNTVAIDSTLTDGNVMIEFPKIWSKVVPDAGDPASATVYICNQQIDDEFKDYAYIDSAGTHKEHMYTPAYNGSYDSNNKMRSISGAQVGKTLSGTTEIERAEANGAGWYTEDAGEVMLINFLLILMGKSVDTQTIFGQGLHTGGSEAINDGFRTGIHNTKGLFYGTNSGTIASGSYGNAVKVFGMENWWGFQWRRYAGDMLIDGVIKVKMCKGRNDGTTVSGYNTDATGYINTGVTPSGTNGGYITLMNFNKYGMFSSVSASSSTTYKDGQWYNTDTRYALRGGSSIHGALVGAFCVLRYNAVSIAHWDIGAALSFK